MLIKIKTDSNNFIAKNFKILNFYSEDTCFAWDNEFFIHFKYPCEELTEFKVLKAPFKIKDILGFEDRVFILCYPKGVYKFKKTGEFAVLSKTGIELGSDFDEVLTVSNHMLILSDKRTKNIKRLFPTSTEDLPVNVLRLDFERTDNSLCKALSPEKFNKDSKLCIISHEKKIFQMSDQVIKIICSCDYTIKNIKPVFKNDKVVGIVVQMDANISIFIHVVDDKLTYDKIFLGVKIQQLCAIIDEINENQLFLIHSDGERTYYSKKKFISDSVQTIKTEEKYYNTFKLYQSKFVIFLNNSNELFQVNIDSLKGIDNHNQNDYVKLDSSMLKNIDQQTEMICEKSDELRDSLYKLSEYEDEFKRINMFMKKQFIRSCPKDSVIRLLNQIFLISQFEKVLPENTIVIKMLKNRGKSIFSMKKVKQNCTTVEMPIMLPNLSAQLLITTDLVTYQNDGIWCLIKNYIKDPTNRIDKFKLSKEQINFLKHKLAVLQILMKENSLTMEALSDMKRGIREIFK